jgi:hypothetical protein
VASQVRRIATAKSSGQPWTIRARRQEPPSGAPTRRSRRRRGPSGPGFQPGSSGRSGRRQSSWNRSARGDRTRAAGPQHPDGAVDRRAVAVGGTTGPWLPRRQQGAQPLPLPIGRAARFHAAKRRTPGGAATPCRYSQPGTFHATRGQRGVLDSRPLTPPGSASLLPSAPVAMEPSMGAEWRTGGPSGYPSASDAGGGLRILHPRTGPGSGRGSRAEGGERRRSRYPRGGDPGGYGVVGATRRNGRSPQPAPVARHGLLVASAPPERAFGSCLTRASSWRPTTPSGPLSARGANPSHRPSGPSSIASREPRLR